LGAGDRAFHHRARRPEIHHPVSGYTVILTGVVSPMTAQALAARGVNVTTNALPGPLQ
jgi:hypothetical protein